LEKDALYSAILYVLKNESREWIDNNRENSNDNLKGLNDEFLFRIMSETVG